MHSTLFGNTIYDSGLHPKRGLPEPKFLLDVQDSTSSVELQNISEKFPSRVAKSNLSPRKSKFATTNLL